MALTMKQQKFCNEYVKTGNAIQSYLTVYNSNSKSAARIESSKLLQRDDITEYIQNTLMKPIQNKAINEREKKRSILWDFIEDNNKSDSDRLKALDLLNKMDQEYVNINKNIDDQPDISNLDTSTLLRLVE